MGKHVAVKPTTPSGLQITGMGLQAFGQLLSAKESTRGFGLNANEVIREGKLSALRVREQGERVQSAQRVGFAKAGVVMSGTPLEVLAQTANYAETNALEIEQSSRRQAAEMRRAAKRAKRSGVLSAVGTVIGAVYGGPAGAAVGGQIGGAIGGG